MLSVRDLPGFRSEPSADPRVGSPSLDLGQPAQTLGMARRCLIALTSSRFRPAHDIAPRFQGLFAGYPLAGWSLRASPPRYFVCWRKSRLVKESNLRLAFFPDRQFGLYCEQKAALCLFELLHREARLKLLARGFSPRLADEPAAILRLQQVVWHCLFGDDRCREPAARFFADLEVGIERAVLGRVAFGYQRYRYCGDRSGV